MTKRIGFTGHRDSMTYHRELERIHDIYPGAIWVHGGAAGFDTQVGEYARMNKIKCEVIRPDYKRYPAKIAPLKRNEQIVDSVEVLVACFDGRLRGGTYQTINYARSKGKPVVFVASRPFTEEPSA